MCDQITVTQSKNAALTATGRKETAMKTGNIYLVTYKEYKNDDFTRQIKVFASDKTECTLKIDESGLICYTDCYANNSGFIVSIETLESGIL